MPNNNKNASSDQAKDISSTVGPAVQPSMDASTAQRDKLTAQSDQTLSTSQGQGEAAGKQFGTAQGTISSTNPTYSSMMANGGFSPSDETTYLNRATQGVKGTYDVLASQAERQRAAAGGMGTGGEIATLARQGTQQQALATENAQADLHQQENANKFTAAAGQVNAGQAETGVGTGLTSLYGQTNQLYNTQTGEITAQGAQVLQALGLKYNTQAEAAQILAGLAAQPGTFNKILQTIGTLGQGYKNVSGAGSSSGGS